MSDTVIDESIPEPAPEEYEAAAAAIRDDTENPAEDTPGDAAEDNTGDNTDDAGGKEAAKYRRKLREAEGERDQLAQQLTAMRRSQIDAQASDMGIKPAALWASGTQLEDMLGDDGVPDPEKITAAVNAARNTLGIHTAGRVQLGTRSGSGASANREHRQASWASALNSPRREQ
jgi:hypothetical protein